jgi:methylglutaconyl-CoA hydratase
MLLNLIKRNISHVLCDLKSEKEGLRLLILQHHEKRNALSSLFITQMQNHLVSLQSDPDAKVLIIRSTVENIFCAGADLKERAEMSNEEVGNFVHKLRHTFNLIEDVPVPTVACVEGVAFGGGLEMALACDFIVGGTKSKVGLVETSIAVIPGAGGTFRLPKVVGLNRAKEMIFTAGIYSADTAHKYGIFNHVSDTPYEKALEIAAAVSKNGPIAVKMAKKALNTSHAKDRDTAMTIEASCYSGIINTQDRIEALKAFKEKRKPVFTGK